MIEAGTILVGAGILVVVMVARLLTSEVYLAEVHAPVLEYSRETGLLELIGEDHVYPTVDLAVRAIEATA